MKSILDVFFGHHDAAATSRPLLCFPGALGLFGCCTHFLFSRQGLTEWPRLALNSQPSNSWMIGTHQMPVMWIGPKQNLRADKQCPFLLSSLYGCSFYGFLKLYSVGVLKHSCLPPQSYLKSNCSRGLSSETQTLS